MLADLFARGEMQELDLTEAALRGRLERMRWKFCELVDEQGL